MRRRVLACGLEFPEGPVLLGDARVAFVEVRGQCVSLWEDGRLGRVARTGGGPNGAALGPDGVLWVTNNGGLAMGGEGGVWQAQNPRSGVIQRVSLTGEVEDLMVTLEGQALRHPNDGCFGPDGFFYFTDPHDWTEPQRGGGPIARCDAAGRTERLTWLTQYPNGIAFGPDDRLYVGETMAAAIHVFDPVPGAKPRVFCRMPAGHPAGFCFDDRGRLWVAGSFGDVIVVFEPDGSLAETIAVEPGSQPCNCALGDGVLYVTMAASGNLEAYDVRARALPLYPRPADAPEPAGAHAGGLQAAHRQARAHKSAAAGSSAGTPGAAGAPPRTARLSTPTLPS